MRPIIAALSLLLLLGACGGTTDSHQGIASAGGGTAGAPPATTTAQSGDMRKFAQCMRDNGIDVPDPDPDGGFGNWENSKIDRGSPAYQKAMKACKSLLPGGGDLSKLDPQLIDQLRQFTQCLRDNGINVSDPDPNSPNLGMAEMQDIDRDSPAFKKAMEACKDKVPGRFGR